MSGNSIPGFTDSERWVVAGALKERYGKEECDSLGDCVIALLRVQADHGSAGEGRVAPY